MGVLPLQFGPGDDPERLGLSGSERFSLRLGDDLRPGQSLTVEVERDDGTSTTFDVQCRLDTPIEIEYYRNGGILHTVLRNLRRREAQGARA